MALPGLGDPLDRPMTARVQHRLFTAIIERLDTMTINLAGLTAAVRQLQAGADAARRRDAAAHAGALADAQAQVDGLAQDVLTAAAVLDGLEPEAHEIPAPVVPAAAEVVPEPAGI